MPLAWQQSLVSCIINGDEISFVGLLFFFCPPMRRQCGGNNAARRPLVRGRVFDFPSDSLSRFY